MKIKVIILITTIFTFLSFLLPYHNCYSQEINRNNYYDYLTPASHSYAVTTNWLSKDEILEIIFNYLSNTGHNFVKFVLMNFDNIIFPLDGFDFYNKFGFVVENGHSSVIEKKDKEATDNFRYSVIDHITSIPKDEYVSNLPKNVFVFKETWYWYENIYPQLDKKTVSKKDISRIVEEDLEYYLDQLKIYQTYKTKKYFNIDEKVLNDISVGSFNYMGENNFTNVFRGEGTKFIEIDYEKFYYNKEESRLHIKGKSLTTNQTLANPQLLIVVGNFNDGFIENFKGGIEEEPGAYKTIHLTPKYTYISDKMENLIFRYLFMQTIYILLLYILMMKY